MINLDSYKVKPTEENPWGESMTIEEIKAACNNAPVRVDNSKKNSECCFCASGDVRGYVSKKLAEKLRYNQQHPESPMTLGTMVVTECDTKGKPSPQTGKPFKGLVLHEQAEFGPAVAAW